jgi:hypothetical protein
MVSVRVGPRLEDDASAKIFRGILVVVKRRYAN